MDKRTLLLRGFLTVGMGLWAAPVFLLAQALPLLPICLLLAAAVSFLPKRRRLPGLIATVLLCAVCGYLYGRSASAFLTALVCALACAGHAALLSQPRGVGFWIAGIAVYVGARLILAVQALPAAALQGFADGYFTFLILLLSLDSLQHGMDGGRGPSRQMTLRNLAAGGLLAAALLLLSYIPQIAALLRQLWAWGAAALAWLSNLLRLPDSGEQPLAREEGMMMPALEQAAPSPFWLFLEKAFHILAACAAIAVGFIVLWNLLRLLMKGVKKLISWLRAYAGAITEGYEDTVESLVDWGEVRRALRLRTRREKKPEDIPWDRLTPRQRVRRGMRDYLRRHPEAARSATARQLLNAKKAALYEAARYTDQEISAEEAETMREINK